MKRKTTRPKYLLLDANIVIKAYELGVWDKLMELIELSVPSIIVHSEALFWKANDGVPHEIDLPKLIADGKITEVTADVEDIKALESVFDRLFIQSIHEGEAEALALIYADKVPGHKFCTSDEAAIRGLVFLDKTEMGISFEKILGSIGLQKTLIKQYTEKFFRDVVKLSQKTRVLSMKFK